MGIEGGNRRKAVTSTVGGGGIVRENLAVIIREP